MKTTLNTDHLRGFIDEKDFSSALPMVEKAHHDLNHRTGKGAEFTGWLDLPTKTEDALLFELMQLGKEIREHSDCLVCIGIGGSYIGIRASLEFLVAQQKIPVYYAGNNLSAGYLYFLLEKLRDKRVTVVVISKSGTTTEPAVAFRIVKAFMEEKYKPADVSKRIICITDAQKGALRKIAQKEGYRTYPISDDVGGRFSVLTPVGLVPLAIAGVNVQELMEGARHAQAQCNTMDLEKNIAYRYATARYLLYKKGKGIEILSTFYQRMAFVQEWWKQLFGESEGKDGKGIFPASTNFTADLHSMGQLIQEGERNMFETFLLSGESGYHMTIPRDPEDLDQFNCVAGKDLDWVNKQAYKATAMAHFEGGVPNMTISVPEFSAYSLGELYYFFEKAVAVTGYLLGVNPFDQPGVEAYKKKMFALLGKK